jgi:putative transposase
VYHVLNRGNGRQVLFDTDGDYQAFVKVIREAYDHVPMRIVDYCIMPNHWHFVLWPREDDELSEFMHRLTVTHAARWEMVHDVVGYGHVYQGRFKDFPVESDRHYLTVCRYVERNPLRAGLVQRAEDWRWGSLWQRMHPVPDGLPISRGPLSFPRSWLAMVNTTQMAKEEDTVRECIRRGRPFGDKAWASRTAERLGLTHTLRPRGRPPGSGRM